MLKLENDIYVAAIPRSGGTLVANVLKIIFNKNSIEHWHRLSLYNKKDYLIVVNRDIRDCVISSYRVRKKFDDIDNIIKCNVFQIYPYIVNYSKAINGFDDYLKQHYGNINCLKLKYENFYNNFDNLFNEIEKFFKITIDLNTKNIIKEKLSIQKQKISQKNILDFRKTNKLGLYGHHIFTGKIGTWKVILKTKYHRIYNYLTLNTNLKIGYKNNPISRPTLLSYLICKLFYLIFVLDTYAHKIRRKIYVKHI